ncbi:heme-binding protein [Mesorhizobium salmacidum]|uniref:Heme-binding protein n=1 Tax=Mesorhizobium salmacidum TaxID=3015171 RepID=A0ABU8L222_9HYPH
MSALNLAAANKIIASAVSAAQKSGLKQLSVVVVQAGGVLIGFQKLDGASMREDRPRSWWSSGMKQCG